MAASWRQVGYWVREFLGENAYAQYVARWQARHGGEAEPGTEHRLLTEREFFSLRLERRYGSGASRC